VVFALSRQINK